jgi:hypothetical protein
MYQRETASPSWTAKTLIRHGEALLIKRSRFALWGARPRPERVLRWGGETGNPHELRGAKLYEKNGKALAVVEPGSEAVLVHPEHGAVPLEEGVWEIATARIFQLNGDSTVAPARRGSSSVRPYID